jgi:hypothetical protein
LLSITSFGILAAVTLLAVGAIYSRALAEGGLKHALATAEPSILNLRITVQNRPLGPADYQNLRAIIEEIADQRISFMLRDIQRHGRAQPNLPVLLRPDSNALESPFGRPFFLTQFERHSRLVAGRWPEAAPLLRERGLEMEAVVGERAAHTMGLEVGSQVFIIPFQDDTAERITVNVVGLAEPNDPDEEYWMGSPGYFTVQEYDDTILIPFYVPEDAFFGGLGVKYPSLVGDYEWFIFVDTSVLTVDTVQSSREALNGLETDINKNFPRSTLLTYLENSNDTGLLATYQRNLTLARVPIFLFLSLVVVVILYFLAFAIGLLSQTRSDEASLLRSRGANMPQVGVLLVMGESVIVVLAVLLGPMLAWMIVQNLLLPTISPAGDGELLSVGLSRDAFIWGGVGGILSLGVLTLSSIGLSRLGILDFLRARARPPSVPFLQRYYIDLLALALLGVLLWQVQDREGFVATSVSERALEVEPTLLLGPALILLAAAFLMLRLLPWMARGLAWGANRFAPSWATFTLSRLSRDPLPYGSLTVIVMLAAALGVFGAAFQATLSHSQQDQARYRLGGDLVLSGTALPPATRDGLYRELLAVPGVQSITPVYRDTVRTLDGPLAQTTGLVGIEPVTLPDTAWYREDFSPLGKTLSELLVPLRRGDSRLPDLGGYLASGIPIPEDSQNIGIWVNTDQLDIGVLPQPVTLSLRLLSTGGQYQSLALGSLIPTAADAQGWRYFEAPLPPESVFLEYPLSVVSLFVTTSPFSRIPPGSISFDDLTVTNQGSDPDQGQVIEDFEGLGRWMALPHDEEEPDTVEVVSGAARRGQGGLSFDWTEALGDEPRGALIPPGQSPIPAVGGPGFYVGQVVRVSAGDRLVPLAISETTDYFPTIYPTFSPFLIVSLESYIEYLRRVGGSVDNPQEFWLALDGSTDRRQTISEVQALLPRFSRIQDRDLAVDVASRDPLAGGAWNGLTLLSIVALATAAVLALCTHAIISVRNGKVDLIVARALGFSKGQMVLSLILERMVVAAVGIIVGSLLGYWLSRWVLGFMDTTAAGRAIIPPVVFTTEAWIIVLTFVGLLLAALLAIALAGLCAIRLRASDILRTTE